MSLVNMETLERVKALKKDCSGKSVLDAYHLTLRALEITIAQLESIKLITEDFELTLVKKDK